MLKIVTLACLLLSLALCDTTVTLNCASCTGGICLTLDGGPFSSSKIKKTQYSSCPAYSSSNFPSSTTLSAVGPAHSAKYL